MWGKKFRTYCRLGVFNLMYVFWYRLGVKLGIYLIRQPVLESLEGPFIELANGTPLQVDSNILLKLEYFGRHEIKVENNPDWFDSGREDIRFNNYNRHWSKIPDFDGSSIDIKYIWEPSRFEWATQLALLTNEQTPCLGISQLNRWLVDWNKKNKTNLGPNWKCGQEASIRVMNMLWAIYLLKGTVKVTPDFKLFIIQHLHRIESTLHYAMAQDNNHGSSEAAALFIGGGWLQQSPEFTKIGLLWVRKGRYWLENRLQRLVAEDGSFSQYSVNYHRVLLDTISFAEYFRGRFELEAFSEHFYFKAKQATYWLYSMIEPTSGDVPNIGANDGARLLSFSKTDYRDYRPSVQLSSALFCNKRAFDHEPSDDLLYLLDIKIPEEPLEPLHSQLFNNGGYALLKVDENGVQTRVYIRYPRFRFRPGHADSLHLDLWYKGKNWLRDGGTFSYNTEPEWLNYFSGTASHNTIQFDGRDQMCKISRFLFSDWLNTENCSKINQLDAQCKWSVSYKDNEGASHKRDVLLSHACLRVVDEVAGFRKNAVLRWRLLPVAWSLQGNIIKTEECQIEISSDVDIRRIELTKGWESRYYMEKNELPVLEVEIEVPGKITTNIRLVE